MAGRRARVVSIRSGSRSPIDLLATKAFDRVSDKRWEWLCPGRDVCRARVVRGAATGKTGQNSEKFTVGTARFEAGLATASRPVKGASSQSSEPATAAHLHVERIPRPARLGPRQVPLGARAGTPAGKSVVPSARSSKHPGWRRLIGNEPLPFRGALLTAARATGNELRRTSTHPSIEECEPPPEMVRGLEAGSDDGITDIGSHGRPTAASPSPAPDATQSRSQRVQASQPARSPSLSASPPTETGPTERRTPKTEDRVQADKA